MKKQEISNHFILKSTGSVDKIYFSDNSKDNFDILTLTGGFTVAFGVTIFCAYIFIKQEFSLFNLFVLVILIIASIYQLKKLLSYYLYTKGDILTIDYKLKIIRFNNQNSDKTEISFSELNKLEYVIVEDYKRVHVTSHIHKYHYWIELFLVTKSQKRIILSTINPRNIIDQRPSKTKETLLKDLKPLISYLSKKLNIEIRYEGIVKN